jgi:hypothetical protein
MNKARLELKDLVSNGFGFVGKVEARYFEEGRLTYAVKEISTGKWRNFSEKQIHRTQAASGS